MERLPLYLALLILPLAVAGQNIGSGVFVLMLLAQIFWRRRELPICALWRGMKVPLVTSGLYVVWGLIASALNPAVPFADSGAFAFGYLYWMLLPPFFFLAQKPLEEQTARRLFICLAVVAAVMGAVAAAQTLCGFKLSGTHFVASSNRAQGFYSHPLTFAYVMLFFVPAGWLGILRRPTDSASWVVLIGGLAGVYASQSRTVQALCALAIVVEALVFAKGRARKFALVVIVALGATVALIDNPMKERFVRTVTESYDVQSSYKDDRLAFWDVHWEMFKERPLLGHGENISTAYRRPYYEKMGLGDLARKFEAHNSYLQVLVNTGVIGLCLYLLWYGWLLRRAWQIAESELGGRMAFTTLVVFGFASMTQNAFQDSEVRYALTLLVCALFLWPRLDSKREVKPAGEAC